MRDGLVDQSTKFKKRIASVDLSPYKVVEKGQLVVGFPIDEAVLALQTRYDKALVSPAYAIWDLDDSKVYPRYLELFLRSPRAIEFYKARLQGSTARRRSLPAGVLETMVISLPALAEQQRIARVLDGADGLRDFSDQTSHRLEELEESIFVHAFGDLVANERGWPVVRVSDFVARFSSGKSIVGLDESADATRPRVLKISAVTSGRFREFESKPLPAGYEPPASHLVSRGDLLFSRANTRELVGATAYVDVETRDLALPDKLWRFEWPAIPRTLPVFVWKMFSRPEVRAAISDVATGSGGSMKNVSQSSVLGLRFALPALEYQQEFVDKIAHADRSRSLITARKSILDEFFASLQHRAFEGRL
jgi:type I restriction enzyme S subunit